LSMSSMVLYGKVGDSFFYQPEQRIFLIFFVKEKNFTSSFPQSARYLC
jgi:hypothetical protein